MLYGKFNNWEPQPMVKMSKIVQLMNPIPNIIERLKQRNLCRPTVVSEKDLNPKEKQLYMAELKTHENE